MGASSSRPHRFDARLEASSHEQTGIAENIRNKHRRSEQATVARTSGWLRDTFACCTQNTLGLSSIYALPEILSTL